MDNTTMEVGMYVMGKLSKHTVGMILREYEAGATTIQLAQKYKVHSNAIGYHLHKYGVKMRKAGRQKGWTVKAIIKPEVNHVAPEKEMAFRTPCAMTQTKNLGFWQKVKILFAT